MPEKDRRTLADVEEYEIADPDQFESGDELDSTSFGDDPTTEEA